MDHWQFLGLLAQVSRATAMREPFPSPDAIWWFGAVLFALWLFAVGASVGSFLNVVVYRVPAGLNLLTPGSRCPRCLHPIRVQHNIPILGWLLLRGRCADCQLPISTRYPLVETLMGVIFLLLGGVELIGNGVNLPRASDPSAWPPLSTSEPWALGVAVMLHLVLVTSLIAAALVDRDRLPIPVRVITPIVAAALVLPLIWPGIHPLPAVEPAFWERRQMLDLAQGIRAGFIDVACGGVAGLLAAAVTYAAVLRRDWLVRRYGAAVLLMWLAIGMVVGWQLVPWLLACWAVHYSLSIAPGRDPVQQPLLPAGGLAVAVLASLLAWRVVARYPLVLDHSLAAQAIIYLVMSGSAFVLLFAAAGRLPPDCVFPPPQWQPEFAPSNDPPSSLPADEPSET